MRTLTLAIPSKGRLMEQAQDLIEKAGFAIDRIGSARGYRGRLAGLERTEIAFLSAADIAEALKSGEAHLGITGEDLLRETIAPDNRVADVVLRLKKAFDAFFRRLKAGETPGYPRFRGKQRYDSLTYPQWDNGVKLSTSTKRSSDCSSRKSAR